MASATFVCFFFKEEEGGLVLLLASTRAGPAATSALVLNLSPLFPWSFFWLFALASI